MKCAVREEVTRFVGSMTTALIAKYSDQNHPEIEKVKDLTKTLLEKYITSSDQPLKALEVRKRYG